MGWAGFTSWGQPAASTCSVKRGGPRCLEAPGALPCASRLRRAGRAVPPAVADGGRQLCSVSFLADPVISISRQVLKLSWKPAWWQPRQHLPHRDPPYKRLADTGLPRRWRVAGSVGHLLLVLIPRGHQSTAGLQQRTRVVASVAL